MLYSVYLISFVLYLSYGIGWERMTNFIDFITVSYLIFPCILILFCTGLFPAFGRAFLFAFGRKEYSRSQCQESLQSVKMVMGTAFIFGGICFLIGRINSIRSMDWFVPDNIGWMFLDESVALLSFFYALLICAVLLPLPFMLKRHLTMEGKEADRRD